MFSRIVEWVKTHKRLTAVIIAVIVLIIFAAIFIFQTVQKRFFPTQTPPPSATNLDLQDPNAASIKIDLPKTTYSMNEKIPLKVVADSKGAAIRGFDVLVEVDPEFLTITEKKTPLLPDFTYYGNRTSELIQVNAVQKLESTGDQVFKDTTLFEFEFTPKKAGKTFLKIIYMPNATNESNLLDKNSKDILGNTAGAEITIQ